MIILRFVHCPKMPAHGLFGRVAAFISRILTELILFDSNSPGGFSHIDGVTTKGEYIGAHVSGVEARQMDYDAGSFSREEFWLLPASDEQTAKWEHYLRAVVAKHEGYSILAIFGFITHFDLNQPGHTICSGLQTLALRWCEVLPRPLEIPAHRISVRDLRLGLMMRHDARKIDKNDPVFKAHIAQGINV